MNFELRLWVYLFLSQNDFRISKVTSSSGFPVVFKKSRFLRSYFDVTIHTMNLERLILFNQSVQKLSTKQTKNTIHRYVYKSHDNENPRIEDIPKLI